MRRTFSQHTACSLQAGHRENFNDSRPLVKFVKFKCSLNFPGLQYMFDVCRKFCEYPSAAQCQYHCTCCLAYTVHSVVQNACESHATISPKPTFNNDSPGITGLGDASYCALWLEFA